MSSGSSSSELKKSSFEKKATNKLDFLLDTIDTEVANFADVVEVTGPILDDQTPSEEMPTSSLNDGVIGTDSLELEMDLLGESDAPPPADKPPNNQAQAATSLNDGATGMDSLELEMDLFSESEAASPEGKPTDNQAKAALDAMNDAEGEVEAMLAKEASVDAETPPAAETSNEAVDDDISKALDELLTTREVDASRSSKKRQLQSKKRNRENLLS